MLDSGVKILPTAGCARDGCVVTGFLAQLPDLIAGNWKRPSA
jgi:hypothetical protein